jgi:predicted dehydrogenase
MNSLTRRRFLEESLLAAAAAAVVEPVRAVAAPGKPSTSPNERLSVAVVGVRGRGQGHADAYAARSDCQLTYVCDADHEVGEKYAAHHNAKGRTVKYVQDLRRVFDDQSVDIVSIATPNHWHSLAAIWAMQAGKDVYVEKPVSHNVSEGRRMVEVARKYGRICQGGTQSRSISANRAAARYVQSGKLGQLRLVRCVMHRPRQPIGPPGKYAVPPSVDYNLWAGPAPMAPVTRKSFHYDWHWFWDFGNGEIGNNNVHAVDTARLIAGLTGLGRGVICYGGRVAFHDAAQTPNVQVAIHDFGSLTLVQEVRNLKTAPPRAGGAILIAGSEGYLVGQISGGNVVYDPAGKLVEKIAGGPSEDHFANFIKAVRSRKREDQNAEILEGHTSTALIHLANISYRLGRPAAPAEICRKLESLKIVRENARETFELTQKHLADNGVDTEREPLSIGPWLTVDAGRETFVGSPAADALLTRDYRKPFVVPARNEI